MNRLLLERYAYSPESTEGVLFLVESHDTVRTHICWTLELPWLNNAPNISCVPEDVYALSRHTRPDGRAAFIINGGTVSHAPDLGACSRYGILIHSGNTVKDICGCVAPGQRRRPGSVWASVLAMQDIDKACADTFNEQGHIKLTIIQKEGAI